MSKKIDAKMQGLVDRIAELERQEKEVHRELVETMGARWQYEREINRSLKPTSAMIYVLKTMLRGATLTSYEWNHPYRYGLDVSELDESEHSSIEYIKGSVVSGLCVREAIEQDENRKGVMQCGYKLTDHGRSIAAKYQTDTEG